MRIAITTVHFTDAASQRYMYTATVLEGIILLSRHNMHS